MKRIEEFGIRLTRIVMIALLLCAVLPSAQAAKGGGGKVSVTDATPSEAFQDIELDVTISGSGFDDGSTASFLVTGTNDDSQIDILSSEYLPSTGQLKTRIKVKGGASAVYYDIEVTNSRGRRGKGSTMFRVKEVETACTGYESKEPTIAYVTSLETSGEILTGDLYLSSESGCDRYLLVDDVAQKLPDSQELSVDELNIQWVSWLRIAVAETTGVVTWIDGSQDRYDLMGLVFSFDAGGNVVPELGGPRPFYTALEGRRVRHQDVRFGDNGDIELVLAERTPDGLDRRISLYNATTDTLEFLITGPCPFQDDLGDCFEPWDHVYWGAQPDDVILAVRNLFTVDDKQGVARVHRSDGMWQQPELLVTPQGYMTIKDVSSDGLMLHKHQAPVRNKRGKITGYQGTISVLDLNLCVTGLCSMSDSVDLPTLDEYVYMAWTLDGSVIVYNLGNGGEDGFLEEYSDPLSSGSGKLKIEGVVSSGSSFGVVE